MELTYHDVTVFAIPEFKRLEVREKKNFSINIIVNQPKTNPNPDPNCKKKDLEKKTLTQKYKIVIAGIRTPNCGVEDMYLNHYDTAQERRNCV